MRSTSETMAYLRNESRSGSTAWRALCLKLQRSARGLPGVYPSAISAAHATPDKYRVYKPENVRRGMVAYFDDPNDSNPFGHITGVAGRNEAGELLHWTNDASGVGRVSKVRHSFFPNFWGDGFMFAATWLNGQVLDMPDAPSHPTVQQPKLKLLDDAIATIKVAILVSKKQENHRLVKALQRDLRELQNTKKRFS